MAAVRSFMQAAATYAGAVRAARRLRSLPDDLPLADAFALTHELAPPDSPASIAANQKPEEILWLLDLLRERPPRTVLEIGLDRGGTLFLWTRVAAPDALLVSLDIRQVHGRLGRRSPFALVRQAFARGHQRIELLGGVDSQAESTRDRVLELLAGRSVDFLFIDGDHAYESVARDFALYEPLLRDGGLAAFHDVSERTTPDTVGTARFWRELAATGQTSECIADGLPGYGIGVYTARRDATPLPARRSVPLSALVSSHDEASLLPRCLQAIEFCDELIVIDVASEDSTATTAEALGARVVRHPPVPIAEAARATVAPQAQQDWLLVVDPDEVLPDALAAEVARLLPTIPDDVAAVDAPRQYYFAGRKLRGTVWGGPNKRRLLVRRDAVELTPRIWGGMRIKPGFRILEMPFTPETAIAHYWTNGWRELVARHRKYLRLEIADRAAAGEITGLRAVATIPPRAFWESYVTRRGYLDRSTGLGLSLFWAAFRLLGEAGLMLRLRRSRLRSSA